MTNDNSIDWKSGRLLPKGSKRKVAPAPKSQPKLAPKQRLQKEIQDFLDARADEGTDILLLDGFEDAFLGVVERFNQAPVACYDRNRCIEILELRDGMSNDRAEEFFQFNAEGARVGEQTPYLLRYVPQR